MVDAGRVDDPRGGVEAVAVEAGGCLVDQLVVEHLGQRLLVVVAADDRDRRDGGRREYAKAPKRSDQPAPGSVAERQIVDGSGKTSETCFAISSSVAVMPM